MTAARLRTIRILLRYLREYGDIPGRWASKRMAATTVALLTRQTSPERRCALPLAELLNLPRAAVGTG